MKKIISLCLLAGVCLTSSMCVSTQKVDSMTFDEKLERIERSTQAKKTLRQADEAFRLAMLEEYYSITESRDMFVELDDCPVPTTPPTSPKGK